MLLLTALLSHGQDYDPSKVAKKTRELYDQAIERAQDGNLTMAVGLLQKCVEADKRFAEAYLALGGAYSQLKSHAASIKSYEAAFAIDSNYSITYKIPYAANLAATGEFEKALAAVESVLARNYPESSSIYKTAQARRKTYLFATSYAKTNPSANYVFAPQNLGAGVNSSDPEYFPSLTIDGSELVFTRRVNNHNEDFYSSNQVNQQWNKAQPLAGGVNTPDNEAAQNISQDGQWLVFSAYNRPQGFGNFDIFLSRNIAGGWSEPLNAGPAINSDQWDAQPCLSPDKKDLYFSSRRPGGFGGADIYVSHLSPDGRWSRAENMGPQINTAGDDQCPFIHADNRTLYFTSNGWPGYGQNDLFYVRKTPAGSWEAPVNLGYPINTVNDEGTLFIASDGKTAFYASDRADSKGGTDIYTFELPEHLRATRTLWVKGKITDSKTGTALSSSVELIDLATGSAVTTVNADDKGHYLVTLPVGHDYAFNVNRKGYLFYSDQFLMSGLNPDTTYEKNIALQPIEMNASVVLRNVFFESNKYELQPASRAELDILARLLTENPSVKIEIGGHTDNVGKPADNLQLSNNRARAVVNYLVSKGIAIARLTAKGYGESKPVADNKTEQGRAANRRTEMRVISQ